MSTARKTRMPINHLTIFFLPSSTLSHSRRFSTTQVDSIRFDSFPQTLISRQQMSKFGKLKKLKSVLKKLNSFANSRHDRSSPATVSVEDDLRTVYVGKSRRRYLLRHSVVDHPLFRELVERSGEYSTPGPDSIDGELSSINVGCEVVMFEHLMWMLEDESDRHDRPESVNELVDFYAC